MFALKNPQVADDLSNLVASQVAERRHAGFRDAVRNNVGELSVGKTLHPGAACHARATVRSLAIEPMAARTACGEDALSCGIELG